MSPFILRSCFLLASINSVAVLKAAVINNVSFNFDVPQSSVTDPAILNSIEVNNATFPEMFFPISYTNIDLSGVGEIRLNTVDVGVVPTDGAAWDDAALLSFQSRNLNYYQQLDANNLNASWRLDYGTSLPSSSDLYIAITERNGNNSLLVEAFDAANNSLGTLNVATGDLTPTGAISSPTNNVDTEQIEAAVYPVADLVGNNTEQISYLVITNNFNNSDGGDGKVIFISSEFTVVVPEPSSTMLLSIFGLFALARRKR